MVYPNRHDLDNLPKIFEEYFESKKLIRSLSLEELKKSDGYRSFLNASSFIRNLVLTGEEVLDIIEPYTQIEDNKEEFEQEIEELKQKIEMRKRVYQTLKDLYQAPKETGTKELKEKMAQKENQGETNTLKRKISGIERII